MRRLAAVIALEIVVLGLVALFFVRSAPETQFPPDLVTEAALLTPGPTVVPVSVSLGGELTRNDFGVLLNGQGGHWNLDEFTYWQWVTVRPAATGRLNQTQGDK